MMEGILEIRGKGPYRLPALLSWSVTLTGGVPSRDSVQPLSDTAAAVLEDYSASHILQQDAVFDSAEAIVIYPAEDTNYALYATPEASYVFAVDKEKFRYQIRDDGTFYQTLYTALNT